MSNQWLLATIHVRSTTRRSALGRYWLVDATTADVRRYGWTMQAYSDDEYEALLAEAGLKLERSAPNLEGTSEVGDFPVLIASRLRTIASLYP